MVQPPRPVSLQRVIQIVLRSIHIAAMGVVLGGCFAGCDYHPLRYAIWATLSSGVVMFALDVVKDPAILHQGSGVLVLVKLALLGIGNLFPGHRFGWYIAATLVASLGSHMPAAWRHYSLLRGREMGM